MKKLPGATSKLSGLLEKCKDDIINDAANRLTYSHLSHYKAFGIEENKKNLETLYKNIVQCNMKTDVTEIVKYAQDLAQKRFSSGFELFEVQAAFNVLEEIIWQLIIEKLSPSDYAEALRLITTILGVAKESFANTYVTCASKIQIPKIDSSTLFAGTDGK